MGLICTFLNAQEEPRRPSRPLSLIASVARVLTPASWRLLFQARRDETELDDLSNVPITRVEQLLPEEKLRATTIAHAINSRLAEHAEDFGFILGEYERERLPIFLWREVARQYYLLTGALLPRGTLPENRSEYQRHVFDAIWPLEFSFGELFDAGRLVREAAIIEPNTEARVELGRENTGADEQPHPPIANLEGIDLLPEAPRVRELRLPYNGIRVIPSGAFLPFCMLSKLCLEHNRLSSIPPALNEIPHLLELSLANNEIQEIGPFALGRMAVLRRLDMRNNMITRCDLHAFSGMPSLERLNVAGNRLPWIAAGLFALLRMIQTIDVSRNLITRIDPHAFSHSVMLREIHVGNNPLDSLAPELFASLRSQTVENSQQSVIHVPQRFYEALRAVPALRHVTIVPE